MLGGRSGHFQLGEGTAKASEQAFKSAHEREMGLNRQDTHEESYKGNIQGGYESIKQEDLKVKSIRENCPKSVTFGSRSEGGREPDEEESEKSGDVWLVLRVVRSATSRPRLQAGLGAAETRRGFREVGVGLSAASAAETAAAGGRAEKGDSGGPERGPLPRPQPRPETVPAVSPSRARPQRHPARPGEVGLSPPEVIPSSLGELGHLSQCVRETLPGVCWGGGVGGEKKKRWVRPESQRPPPPPPDGPRPFALCERQRRGGGETEEAASRHGLGVTEFPGRPGGCGRQGRTTPAGAAAQRPARETATGAEPTGPGRLGGASRKRGPWAPLCEGRRRGAGQPPAAGSLDACLPAGAPVGPAASPRLPFPSGGASRLPPPSSGLLRARPSPRPLPGLQFL
ncbi:basic salivary proline-rich protein 3-like [Moschus berezovskii]|uniref:basic salivary proline-rich protein 3-like n=1 Tax=Moschus berezovskii TaxID=68408 RepID=UPI0024438042|nr:basic salivary proline-rich protein 3-like [Moschus berezovskii]